MDMERDKTKGTPVNKGLEGELVTDNDSRDIRPTGRYTRNNPYKTPPNKFTTKENKGS